ncbi:YafY family protein [Desulfosporosinus sp. PR]|uniref:helix-turn-helix transcriptional regulator n=1 Tax=Candidatus Desulfosporosinus nitrosoreducens TaxID=3401928 RepID=UPI0027F41A36|nr:YafY family protein [Desulfosporosinus sp. PR]MDQ7094409.1 YafY family protein [Desulfosporosinus sp. PR]
MQINRLLEIVYILFEKKIVTAKKLSEHFEVSQRTIYRDVDVLSAAGIPIYANKGKGGGISLLENFVIKKSILSEKEQIDILSSLQGMKALNVPDAELVLKKLAAMFDKNYTEWIDVDFSPWGSNSDEKEKFNLLKTAIINKNPVEFDYYSSYGEKTKRIIEPLQLMFKGRAWYVYGFCTVKNDYRMFRVTRIKNLALLKEKFARDIPQDIWEISHEATNKMIKLVMKIEASMAYRVYDEFGQEAITKNADGSFTVTANLLEDEWVYGYVLSFGDYGEVLEPEYIRKIIKGKLERNLKNYL